MLTEPKLLAARPRRTSARAEGEERWVRSEEERRKALGTTRRVREERWVRSAATEEEERRLVKSERSGVGMDVIFAIFIGFGHGQPCVALRSGAPSEGHQTPLSFLSSPLVDPSPSTVGILNIDNPSCKAPPHPLPHDPVLEGDIEREDWRVKDKRRRKYLASFKISGP
ncbi:hypothetical protein L1049_014276 [Liquidambar formosana]|uniref:Uncharacterized protein n=1 Tax=Liquidambar formosana TaxID=63359 RepID=A0AAP0WV43_LIQFO